MGCRGVEKRINVDIPAGIEEGTRLRLKNQGPKGRGDMYVEAHVTLPEKLSAEEQEAVKSFAEKAGLKY